jgi:hypothetical protein
VEVQIASELQYYVSSLGAHDRHIFWRRRSIAHSTSTRSSSSAIARSTSSTHSPYVPYAHTVRARVCVWCAACQTALASQRSGALPLAFCSVHIMLASTQVQWVSTVMH